MSQSAMTGSNRRLLPAWPCCPPALRVEPSLVSLGLGFWLGLSCDGGCGEFREFRPPFSISFSTYVRTLSGVCAQSASDMLRSGGDFVGLLIAVYSTIKARPFSTPDHIPIDIPYSSASLLASSPAA